MPAAFPPLVWRCYGVPFRYTVHWGSPGRPATVEIHADPNPMPRFRLWRWGGGR